MNQVQLGDLFTLIELFDESTWDELRIVSDEFEIYLSNSPADRDRRSPGPVAASTTEVADARSRFTSVGSTPTRIPESPSAPSAPETEPGQILIRAANLGTFYRAPKPGAKPYVEIGQPVEPDTDVCVIEIMKLFTVVTAGVTGVVRRVLVKDGQLVEFDQPLFLIEVTA